MIISEHIHQILANNPALPESVRDNVQCWASDDDTPWEQKFPMITHIDLSNSPQNNSLGIWRADYQVSVWAKTKLEGRQIMANILQILNRYTDQNMEMITVQNIGNSYDNSTGTNGLHARFAIIYRENFE